MEVKPSYKQTEVGVIPEEWDVKSLFELVTEGPKNGYSGLSGKNSRGTPTLSLAATTTGMLVLAPDTVKRLDETIDPRSELFLKPGDVLVQRSNTLELVGTTAVFDGPANTYIYPDLMMRMRFREEPTAHWFWRYANSAAGRRFFVSVAAGSSGSMPKVSGDKLRKMRLPLPTSDERLSISKTLGDMDALARRLDRLVAKKRDLKQATMQQLLSGRIRLPGFRGEWRPTKFAELLKYERPDQFLVGSADYAERGDTPVLTANKSFVLGYTNEAFGIYENIPVIIFDDFTTDSKYVDFSFKVKSSAIKILKPRSVDVNLKFVFERMRLVQFPLGEHKRYYISEYQHIELPTPEPDEQTAIAEVLTEMDAELAALERRREKTRALKQAMMQELLTGKTRLV